MKYAWIFMPLWYFEVNLSLLDWKEVNTFICIIYFAVTQMLGLGIVIECFVDQQIGLTRQGVVCETCGLAVHTWCCARVAPRCPLPAERTRRPLGIDPARGQGTAYEGYVKVGECCICGTCGLVVYARYALLTKFHFYVIVLWLSLILWRVNSICFVIWLSHNKIRSVMYIVVISGVKKNEFFLDLSEASD